MNQRHSGPIPENTRNQFLVYLRENDAKASPHQQESDIRDSKLDRAVLKTSRDSIVDSSTRAAECVRNSPLFAGLPPTAQQEIAAKARLRSIARHQPIFREDDAIRYVCVLVSGTVKITRLTEAGCEVILRVNRAYSPIDDMCSTYQKTRTTNAFAMCDCCVLAWCTHEFAKFEQRFPGIHRNATRIVQRRLMMLERSFCDLSTARVPQRLARVLLQLSGDDACHDQPIGFSRQELAQMAGTSPFMISRLVSAWAERGIVTVSRSEVSIGDLATLTRISDGISS